MHSFSVWMITVGFSFFCFHNKNNFVLNLIIYNKCAFNCLDKKLTWCLEATRTGQNLEEKLWSYWQTFMFLVTLQLNDYTNISSCRIWERWAFPSSPGSGLNLWSYRGVEEAQHAPALPGKTQTNFWLGRSVMLIQKSLMDVWRCCDGKLHVLDWGLV